MRYFPKKAGREQGPEAHERAADLALAALGEVDQPEYSQPETNTHPLVLGQEGSPGLLLSGIRMDKMKCTVGL